MTGFRQVEAWEVEPIFKDIGLPIIWATILEIGNTKLYDNDTKILNYYISTGICVINSISINDDTFPKSMLKDIKTLIKQHKKVIIASKVASIGKYLSSLGFRYNTENRYYYKGISWE